MTSPSLRIGIVGRILSGEEVGRYVKVVDDSENTGGYLILTAADKELADAGADAWVETRDDLAAYFEESAWTVEWLD